MLVGIVSAVALDHYQIINVGNTGVTAVDFMVYWDPECTDVAKFFDWETVLAGENKTIQVWFNNTGVSPTTYNYSVTNWNPPAAENHLSLTWNYTDFAVLAGQVIPVEFTLAVHENVTVTDFSFTLLIIAQKET
jgi:hypothetical protein